jgi:hypothetical protein
MADSVAAEKRAQDVVDKYHKRMDDWSKMTSADSVDEHNAIITELKADIANAINAVINEFAAKVAAAEQAVKDVKGKHNPESEPEPRARPATTHMPATGTHGRK